MKRNHHHTNHFARRLRRLRLSLDDAVRYLRTPYGTVKNWRQGRREAPRAAMRLLAVYRLHRWGSY